MTHSNSARFTPPIWYGALLSSLILVGCASAPQSSLMEQSASAPREDVALPQTMAVLKTESTTSTALAAPTALPRTQLQLVKTAELQITVKSITDSLDQIKAIAQQNQGDLLNLQDQTPTASSRYRTASVQLRVPQAKLETVLQALKPLGSLERQAIAAEDVSNQLVDFQARLKNLRKTEETLLDIMGRSGGISDVLKVSQELSNVRNAIEQLTAQLQTLQNQVAYSTIRLNLAETVASVQTQPDVGVQLHNTWERATQSVGKFTVDLLQLGIWLLIYSPYWLVLGAIATVVYGRLKPRHSPSASED